MYRSTINHEPRGSTHVTRKGITAWIFDRQQSNSGEWWTNCTDADNDRIQDRAFTDQRQWCHRISVHNSVQNQKQKEHHIDLGVILEMDLNVILSTLLLLPQSGIRILNLK